MSILTTPEEMLTDLRNWLDEPSPAFWTNAQLMKRLHDAQQRTIREIDEQDPSFFVATYDISFVADQALYDVPLNARLGTRWVATENRISGTPYYYCYPVDLRRYLLTESTDFPWATEGSPHVTFQGNQLRVSPTPSKATSNAIRWMYNPTYGNMLQWQCASTSTTTFTFTSGSPDYTSSWGQVDPRDDFYNGMTAFVVSGAGIGQYRTISDYDGSSRQFTTAAWTTHLASSAATSTSTIALMCPVPEDLRDVVVLGAARKSAVTGRTRVSEIKEAYAESRAEMLDWADERQEFLYQTVEAWGGAY